jgi:hypothetical protein
MNNFFAQSKTVKVVAISVLVLVIVAIIILIVVKYKGKLTDTIKNRELAESLDEEINQDDITLTQTQLNTFASSLYAAMDGAGTDEDKIYNVFRAMGTRSDVLQLIKTFGVKDGETLTEWLNGDLSSKEIDKINSILANNNINYQF